MFYLNQKVVCVKEHSQGRVQVGRTYTVFGFWSCSCGIFCVDVGLKPRDGRSIWCPDCYMTSLSSIWWINAELFRPLQEEKGEMFIEEFMIEPIENLN